jgi:DNA-binding NarL/FixJ family response regulator
MDADVEGALERVNVPSYVIDTAGVIRWVNPVSSVPLVRGGHVIGVFGQVVHQDEHAPIPSHPALTPRQTEVLRQLERGRSTLQIAEELQISPETVRNHVRHLLHALGVHSRLEAVAAARAEHLVA